MGLKVECKRFSSAYVGTCVPSSATGMPRSKAEGLAVGINVGIEASASVDAPCDG